MTVFINNQPEQIPDNIKTISQLADFKGLKADGTAIALNDSIVRKGEWESTRISDGDRITVITAAFGG